MSTCVTKSLKQNQIKKHLFTERCEKQFEKKNASCIIVTHAVIVSMSGLASNLLYTTFTEEPC